MPKLNDEMFNLQTSIPHEINDALDKLVKIGGLSKATYVRMALLNLLVEFSMIFPSIEEPLVIPTTARGVLASDKTREAQK